MNTESIFKRRPVPILHLLLQCINPLDDVHNLHAFQYVGRNAFRTCTGKDTDHIADHEIMVLGGTFIRAVVISRIRRRQFRHFIIFNMTVFDFVHILSADFHASVLRNNQHTAFHVPVPDRSGIAQAPHPAVHEVEIHKARIFKSRKSGMVEIGKASLDIADIPEKPVHNVDEMGELGKKRPSVQSGIAMPATGFIIALVTVPITIQLDHIDLA